MRAFAAFLTLFGLGCFTAGCLHLVFGPGADAMLGAELGDAAQDPVLDSQNRFYGAIFAGYGLLFAFAASNLERYRTLIKALCLIFFAGGLARLLAWWASGSPSGFTVALLASELTLPPVILLWLHWLQKRTLDHQDGYPG